MDVGISSSTRRVRQESAGSNSSKGAAAVTMRGTSKQRRRNSGSGGGTVRQAVMAAQQATSMMDSYTPEEIATTTRAPEPPSRPPPRVSGHVGGIVKRQHAPIRRVAAPVQHIPKVEGSAQFGSASSGPPGPQLKALQDDVLRAVTYRESVLLQLQQLVSSWPSRRPPKAVETDSKQGRQFSEAVRALRNISRDLRECGLRCVEKIVAWVLFLDPDADEPTPFLWNGQDYLLKMSWDMDFVMETVGPEAKQLANFSKGNPLLLSEDELQGRGIRAQIGRVHAAGVVILDVVKRHRRKSQQQGQRGGGSAGSETHKRVLISSDTGSSDMFFGDESMMQRSSSSNNNNNHRESSSGHGGKGTATTSKRPDSSVSEEEEEVAGQGGEDDDYYKKKRTLHKTSNVLLSSGSAEVVEEEEHQQQDDKGTATNNSNPNNAPSPSRRSSSPKARKASRNQVEEQAERRRSSAVSPAGNAKAGSAAPSASANNNKGSHNSKQELQGPVAKGHMLGAYEVEATIGEGAYGWVLTAHKKGTPNLKVAIKKFKDDEDEDEETANYALKTQVRELKFLQRLKHPNIVTLIDDFEDDMGLCFVFEYIPENCLQALERLAPQGLPAPTIRVLSQQLCEAILFCHKNRVMHRDIKPENLLVSDIDGTNPVLKLCDFGSARDEAELSSTTSGGADLTHYVGSRWYRAPELLGSSTHYTRAVDIWSAGCIIAEMLTGKPLFEAPSDQDMIVSMQSLLGPPPGVIAAGLVSLGLPREKVNSQKAATRSLKVLCGGPKGGPDAADLVARMLAWDPQTRMEFAVNKLLGHPYLNAPTTGLGEEHDRALTEALRVLTGRSARLTDKLRKMLNGSERPEDCSTEVGKAVSEAATTVAELFLERFLPVASNKEKLLLLEGLLAAVEASCVTRLVSCKNWLSGRSMSDLSMAELADGLERKHVASNKNERRICEACLSLAGHLHEHLSSSTKDGVDDVAVMSKSPINTLISSVAPLILDPRSSSSMRRTQLERVFSLMGLPSPLDIPNYLSPNSKTTLLLFRLFDAGTKRLPIVLSRETALKEVMAALRSIGASAAAIKGPSGRRASILDTPVLVPYFRSAYGKKVVDGQPVEEGEGMGPRKELFAILSAQLQKTSTRYEQAEPFLVSAQHGTNVLQAPHGATFPPEMMVGWKVQILITQGPTPETCLYEKRNVVRIHSDSKVTVDRPWSLTFTNKRLDIYMPNSPLLVYHKAKECLWINAQVARSEENMHRFRVLGLLLGLAVANQCSLDMNLPPLFFKIVMAAPAYEPTMEDLAAYDPSIVHTLEQVKEMPQEGFEDMLRAEGLEPDLVSREMYIRRSLNEVLYSDGVSWMFEAIGNGLTHVLPAALLQGLRVSGRDLMVMACGLPQTPNDDFSFQEYFQVTADPELKASPIWPILWDVIAAFEPQKKRKLLKFITGVNKLPAPGTEILKIESPLVAFNLDDHRKMVALLPQSHTCDNILELPNYFESLVKLWRHEHPTPRASLPADANTRITAQCAKLLEFKLTQAIENSFGYGLDEVLHEPQHQHRPPSSTVGAGPLPSVAENTTKPQPPGKTQHHKGPSKTGAPHPSHTAAAPTRPTSAVAREEEDEDDGDMLNIPSLDDNHSPPRGTTPDKGGRARTPTPSSPARPPTTSVPPPSTSLSPAANAVKTPAKEEHEDNYDEDEFD